MTDVLANDAVRIALLLLLFAAIVVVVYAVASFVGERQAVQDRLSGNAPSSDPSGSMAGLRVHDARGAWVALVTAIEKAGIPLVDTKDATIRSRLVAAGYTQAHAPRVY